MALSTGPECTAGHVLIIEDDEDLRQLETIALQARGWVVSVASSGRVGVAVAAEMLPEVIICDRLLPDIDGIDVIAALARDPATASIPVVMVTGMGESDDIVDGLDAGAHDYLVKPFQMVELEVRCRAALRSRRQHRLLARSEYELRLLAERTRADESTLQLAAIVASSNDAILSKTLDGIILTWNAAAEMLYGYSAEEIVGKSVSVLVPADRSHEVSDLLAKVRRGEAVDHFESLRVRKDGSVVPVSLTISPVRDATGKVASASTIAHDITERDRERYLDAARKEANEANRLKSEFLASMSHEIRTPMTGIVGMADLILDTDLNELQRRYVLAIRDAGNNLKAIVNDILDLSKIEAGRLELEAVDYDLDEAVDSVVSLLTVQARSKGLALRLDIASDVPTWIRGDPLRLRQVLINLVGNAVKFTDTGIITVAVAALGDSIRFSVADTGIGIDPSHQAGLLDPFVQADRSTARRFGGTGLGLAICAQLVDLMGGTMSLESRSGKGSIFWFDVPLARAHGPHPDRSSDDPADVVPGLPGNGARILLADDTDINQIVGVAMLERMGYTVDVVANGAEALAAVERTRYDAVLMDCLMPVMDGYEATARVRALSGTARHTPIIAITASAMVGDRERCMAAGMDGYVSKPIDPTQLADALARCRSRYYPQPPVGQAGGTGTASEADGDERDNSGDDHRIDAEIVAALRHLEQTIGAVAFAAVSEAFMRTCPPLIRELNGAVASGDIQTTRLLAHKLKGGMNSFGAARLCELATRIERGEPNADDLGPVLAELDREFTRVRDLLNRSSARN